MGTTLIPLVNPAGNGAAIAHGAACPVVQSPADPTRGHANVFRVTCTKAHSWVAYGFADASSTTLTDGTELSAGAGKAATTGNGYQVELYSNGAGAGLAIVVTNGDGADAADIGVSRVLRAL